MGSMALQLKPWTVPDASDVFAKALTLRDLADQRRYRQLQQQSLQLKLEQEREEMEQTRSLRDLFSTNPNPTEQEILRRAPLVGLRHVTERRQAATAATQAKTAELTQQQKERELAKADLQDMIGDIRFIKKLPPHQRDSAFLQIQDKWNKRGKPLNVDTVPTDEELDAYMEQAYELKDRLDIQSKQQGITNAQSQERRAQEKHVEDVTIKAPLEREKLTADVELAKRKLQGNEPATGTLREFKDVYYPGYLAAKGIKNPTARDEYNAYVEFRELLRARVGGVPGVDVPYSPAVQQQRIDTNAARAKIGDLSPIQFTRTQVLASQFDSTPIVKQFNETNSKFATLKGILSQPKLGGPGDLAIIYEFMKGLDPTSVVRESEYASAAASGNIFSGAWARFNGYLKPEGGFLPPQVKKSFLDIVNQKLNVSKRQVRNLYDDYGRRIEKITGQSGGKDYLTDYTGLLEEEPKDKSSAKPGDLSGVSTEELLKRLQGK